MSNFIYYEKLQDYEEQVRKAKEFDKLKQQLQEIKEEHNIMKQFIYENGLWEKFLNDDRFIEYLRSE